jgi:type VI secretion system secreted protein Hcp
MRVAFPARLVAACALAVTCWAAPGFAASDYLLEIDGIQGEASDSKGTDIQAYSYDVKSPRDIATGQASGKRTAPSFSDISISKSVGKSSPLLMQACCRGTHFPSATITCRRSSDAGAPPEPFMQIKLTDVVISSYQSSGGTPDGPTDTFSLNFTKIEFSYKSADGSVTKGNWDLATLKGA